MNTSLQKIRSQSHTISVFIVYGSALVLLSSVSTATAISQGKNLERVKMGEVIAINYIDNRITVIASTTYILGEYDEETLFYLGSGKSVGPQDIQLGQTVYLFGTVPSTTTAMKINKIVVRNTSKLLRKIPSSGTTSSMFFARGITRSLRENNSFIDQDLKDLVRTYIP